MTDLAALAREINSVFEASDDRRLEAGRLLVAARRLVPHGTWRTWCDQHLRRSYRDVQRLVAIAESDNPVAALAAARKKTAEAVAAHKARRLAKSPSPPEVLPAPSVPPTVFVGKSKIDTATLGPAVHEQIARALAEPTWGEPIEPTLPLDDGQELLSHRVVTLNARVAELEQQNRELTIKLGDMMRERDRLKLILNLAPLTELQTRMLKRPYESETTARFKIIGSGTSAAPAY